MTETTLIGGLLVAVVMALPLSVTLAAQDDRKARQQELLETAAEVQQQVAELRGYPFKRPVSRSVMTKDELRAVLAEMMHKEMAGGELERTEAWLSVLGLVPQGLSLQQTMTDVLLSQIGGFYDPDKGSFYMMIESTKYGDTMHRMMIAHELCHALDDQYCDLATLRNEVGERSEDLSYVVGSVVEGSATVLMTAWASKAMKDGAGLGDMRKMAEQQRDQMAVLLEAPVYCALVAANYMVGLHFMTKGEGAAAIAAMA